MTLRRNSNTSSRPAESINSITASRLAHAAGREIPGNLFRLLVDLSSTDAGGQAPPPSNDKADLGPPWDHTANPPAEAVATPQGPADA
jgi:hypothetical protein